MSPPPDCRAEAERAAAALAFRDELVEERAVLRERARTAPPEEKAELEQEIRDITRFRLPEANERLRNADQALSECRSHVPRPSDLGVPEVVDVTAITGARVEGPLTSWQTRNGPFNVEHLAGRAPNGDLLAFWWSPQRDWQVVNITQKTGRRIASTVTSWQAADGPMLVEYLAAHDEAGSLLVFWWSSAHDWQVLDVSALTKQRVGGSPASWITGTVVHVGVRGPNDALLVFWNRPGGRWGVVNVDRIAGEDVAGGLSAYQLSDGSENVELLSARGPDGSLLVHWWKPSRDWQVTNLSNATGRRIASDPTSWVTAGSSGPIEHHAAADDGGSLLVIWGGPRLRQLIDTLTGPYREIKRTRGVRRRLLAILWDPHRPTDSAPTRQAVEALLFGATNSVRHYYLENSNGYFTIEKAGALGWYDADKPPEHYWGPVDTNDSDGDGWVNPHVEKWAEAIRKANVDFNFASFDSDPHDGQLRPSELGVLIVIPQNIPHGFNRGVVGREFPQPQPLVVDGVRIGVIAEAYIGSPPNLGLVAHELAHLFLDGPDLHYSPNFPQPYRPGDFSLMDGTYEGTHFDPFLKLKYGWLRPQVILRSDTYTLADVETRHAAWVLTDLRRRTDEYFLVENRWPGESYDRAMPDRGGLAVWHIMENPAVYGALPPPPGVTAEQWAKVETGDWGRRGIRLLRPAIGLPVNDRRALWDGSDPANGYDLLSEDPNPSHTTLRWADGTPSGFAIRSISAAGAEMTARIDVPF